MDYFEDETYLEIKSRKQAIKQVRQQASIQASNDGFDYSF